MYEDEDEAEAGCYEAEAQNFGLEATLAVGLEDLTSCKTMQYAERGAIEKVSYLVS